jgi:hypothetical protein
MVLLSLSLSLLVALPHEKRGTKVRRESEVIKSVITSKENTRAATMYPMDCSTKIDRSWSVDCSIVGARKWW